MNNPGPLLFDKYNHFLSCFKIYKSSLGLTINAVDIPIHIFLKFKKKMTKQIRNPFAIAFEKFKINFEKFKVNFKFNNFFKSLFEKSLYLAIDFQKKRKSSFSNDNQFRI